jgi:pilus assembly protein CpaC
VPLLGGNGAVSVEWKKFGIGLEFLPQIVGETIHLRVRPEVSAPDFANGVILNNFRIPLLTQRYADTEVELQDGQSFAIAGLLDHVDQNDKAAIPILSRIPIIGKLFQSKNQNDTRQELLVLITARLVQPLNPDQLPALPKIIKKDGGGR